MLLAMCARTSLAEKREFHELVELLARLRAPDGCPWDRKQDHRSLRTYLLEETYEVLDAIDRDDPRALADELGDMLLQVLFHAQLAHEQGRFSIDDVLSRLHDKLVRRHPHVFGQAHADTPEQVKANWEALKAEERHGDGEPASTPSSRLDPISRNLPALLEAFQVNRRAAQAGFDWERVEDVLDKIDEETVEIRQELATGRREFLEDEAGDLLFAAVNVVRALGFDPEVALRRANQKFRARFRVMEQELAARGKPLEEASLAELDELWERAKAREGKR